MRKAEVFLLLGFTERDELHKMVEASASDYILIL